MRLIKVQSSKDIRESKRNSDPRRKQMGKKYSNNHSCAKMINFYNNNIMMGNNDFAIFKQCSPFTFVKFSIVIIGGFFVHFSKFTLFLRMEYFNHLQK